MLGLLVLNLLFGCADYAMMAIEKREPEILVHPLHLNFGHLESGVESDQKYFTVTNTGDDDLIITSPFLVSGNDRFGIIDSTEDDIVIPGGEFIQVDVSYIPETYESNGAYIEITTSDEDESYIQVTLEGYGDAPVMSVSPSEFDYGVNVVFEFAADLVPLFCPLPFPPPPPWSLAMFNLLLFFFSLACAEWLLLMLWLVGRSWALPPALSVVLCLLIVPW